MKISHVLLLSISLGIAVPLFSMDVPLSSAEAAQLKNVLLYGKLKKTIDANEQAYLKRPVNEQQMITVALLQPARGFRSLETYVNNLTNEGRNTYKTDMGLYKRLDPTSDWHMTLMTFAIPLPRELGAELSREIELQNSARAGGKRYFVAATTVKAVRDFAERALRDLGEASFPSIPLFDKVSYEFEKIAGIGTNKFIAAYFMFKDPPITHAFLQAYLDVITRLLQKYPDAWMPFGFDPLPHVSIMVKTFEEGKPEQIKAQPITFVPSKGSGGGIPKVQLMIPDDVRSLISDDADIKDLKLLHAGRVLEASARGFLYPPFETDRAVSDYARGGKINIVPGGTEIKKGIFKPKK